MLVASTGKNEMNINAAQKRTMQAIFGDTSTLQAIKLRLSQSEQHGEKLCQLLNSLQKSAVALRTRLQDAWCDLSLVI